MSRGKRSRARTMWATVGVIVGIVFVFVVLASSRVLHPLFPVEEMTSCTVTEGVDHHHVRKGPDFSTIDTTCGTFTTDIEVTCSADPSRTTFLIRGLTFDLGVRGPRIPVLSDPTVVAVRVSAVQAEEPFAADELDDGPLSENLEALRDRWSPESLRAWDYEQPPFDPACDSYRTIMTSEGLQIMHPARAASALRAPEGITPRDPLLPCEGWECDRP